MKHLCIYHGGCTDGVASAVVFWNRVPDATFWPGVYQRDPPWELVEGRHVTLLDFSYKRPVMEKIVSAARTVTVLDHHASAERELAPLLEDGTIFGEFDMGRCGSVMAWHAYFPEHHMPAVLRYIDARDRWVQDADLRYNLEHVIFAIRSHDHTQPDDPEKVSDWLAAWDTILRAGPQDLAKEGAAIHRYYRTLVDDAKRRAQHFTLQVGEHETHTVPAANAPYALASDVAGELAANDHRHGWAFVYWRNSDGSWTASLRSRGDVDVSRIAEHYGGGGHVNAAGFRVDAPVWVPA